MGIGLKLGIFAQSGVNNIFSNLSTQFDGSDESVDCNTTLSSTFSVSAWFKVANTTDFQPIFSTRVNEISTSRGIDVYIQSNILTFRVYRQASTSVTQAFTDTGWNHVMLVYSGTTLKAFLNSSSIGTNTGTYAISTETLKLGRWVPTNDYAEANIDEVSVFSSDESPNLDIIYNSGTPGDISSLTPLNWWRMGEGSTFPTINDIGSGGSNATMKNMSSANFVNDTPL